MNNDDSGSFPHRRRYPRIVIPNEKSDLHTIIGVNAQIPSGEKVPVLDLSYAGAAILKTASENEKVGEPLPLQFYFEGGLLKPVSAEIVRTSDRAVGLRFGEMSPETRLSFDKIMNDKMLGLNTHRVRTDLLNSRDRRHNLTHWYHGPKDTNIFIWIENEKVVKKFIIEIDYQVIDYDRGEMTFNQTVPETEFFREGYSGYGEVRTSGNVSFSQTELIKRAVNVLTHVLKRGVVIDNVIDVLLKRMKN
ncbi:MAG: hypothetical protein A4S09_11195 [Proteobacteria bacterium SG_bin7]|nr:MAG: hypothetical protein A4S09_11195 [Proteobacteria bacterium SG_bin7]